jgi:ADP-heptose:LPS heptosyltransferase
VNKPLPQSPTRVLLVNPTKYLGNLLLAGGLMQAYAEYCKTQHIELKIVIDESFRALCENSFPNDCLIYFPRTKISQAGFLKKISLYWRCLKQVRAFKADLAFNIEEDSATNHLTRFSAANFKLGCSPLRHKKGYDHILPLRFENREPEKSHRWHSYYDVFAALNMPEPDKQYIDLKLKSFPESLATKLKKLGWHQNKTTIALHAGATKDYKKWPLENFSALIEKILEAGVQAVLLGAGSSDEETNLKIIDLLEKRNIAALPVNLCNSLSLTELAQFLQQCNLMVGNDSGPFHLGSALGIPGLVLWGPTEKSIWGPLGLNSDIVTGNFICDPACNKGLCLHQHRCLNEILPAQVFDKVQDKLNTQKP